MEFQLLIGHVAVLPINVTREKATVILTQTALEVLPAEAITVEQRQSLEAIGVVLQIVAKIVRRLRLLVSVMVFHQLIGRAVQVQIDVVLAKVIVMSIVIALLAFNVEQTIVIETSRRLEVIGTAWPTVVLHHPPSQRLPQDQQWPLIAMESLQPTGVVVPLPINAMSMKEIVILIVIALELLYAGQTTVGQLDYLEVVGLVVQIAA